MNIYIKYLLKGIFLFAIVFMIDLMVFSAGNLEKLESIKEQLNTETYIIFFIVFLLQFLNWGLESLKFKFILSKKKVISLRQSVVSVYTGNATGLLTPDRLGTFIGRFIYLKHINKKTVTAATMLGNLAQLTTTISFALIALLLYQSQDFRVNIPYMHPTVILFVLVIILVVLTYSFYKPKKILIYFSKLKWIAKHKDTFSFLSNFNKKESTIILTFSFLRYCVFIIQFHLLLNALGLPIELMETLMFSGLLYLFTTVIPSPLMGNLGTRELIALILLSNYQQPEVALVASLIIWLINVIIPSLVGSYILLKMNPSKKQV